MARIAYTEDEDFPGQFELWEANCWRSIRGKIGQRELRILREALLALPEKRLIHDVLEADGEVCAIAAYARFKGLDLNTFDDEGSDRVGMAAGMPRLIAWKVVELNDMWFDRATTPEERYCKMLKWVEAAIMKKEE